jgi:DNA-binding transcriptional LysR family regulator
MHKSTLEQWRMLQAVVDHGGFAQAAAAIHKSQSSINHAVHKLQDQLGLKLLEVRGRKAHLTDTGQLMLRRARQLLAQADQLQEVAASLSRGQEAELRLAADEVFPYESLARALCTLSEDFPHTRVQLMETVLSGGPELLSAGEVDLLVAGSVPSGFLGEALLTVEFIAVAHPEHPLHALGRPLTLQDLAGSRQIVVRDSARGSRVDSGWLGAEQRWTVSHLETSVDMISRGMGFAWLPRTRIDSALASGRLKPLDLEQGRTRKVTLYLTFADPDRAGPVTRRLGDLLTAEGRLLQQSFD